MPDCTGIALGLGIIECIFDIEFGSDQDIDSLIVWTSEHMADDSPATRFGGYPGCFNDHWTSLIMRVRSCLAFFQSARALDNSGGT
ncbi:hypothetical protein IP70_16480 [alpha proteobacterium AAP38]|nr:hypothetical protein IP70_16480 [alpha proteobacterium AAP38]